MEWITALSVVVGGTGLIGLVRLVAERAYPRRLQAAIARNVRTLDLHLDPKIAMLVQQAIDTDVAKLAAVSLARPAPRVLTMFGVGAYAFAVFAGLCTLGWASADWSALVLTRIAPIVVILGAVALLAPYLWLMGSAIRRGRQYDYATSTIARTRPPFLTADVEHGRRILWVERHRARRTVRREAPDVESEMRRRWRRRRARRLFWWSGASGIPL